jgi:hypothetical protein
MPWAHGSHELEWYRFAHRATPRQLVTVYPSQRSNRRICMSWMVLAVGGALAVGDDGIADVLP